ncbi:hypothetical protein [Paracoccus thiocyanatus]|uniref:hypothetical protein n=1 Tax=Paracoccus thiocyanatus TaxID=34006 RepID=UPI002163D0C1|nr:hypothetical protein [Paracoccus thiocyanatus]
MTPDELIAALAPSRLPPGLMALDWRGMLALAGLACWPGWRSPWRCRRCCRAAPRAAPGSAHPRPAGGRALLAIARILGRLPAALRAPAYGAAPMPPQDEVERLARRRR